MAADGAARIVTPAPFADVFSMALRGAPCTIVGLTGDPTGDPTGDGAHVVLPVDDWTRTADEHDLAILEHCDGPVVDLGCGPGRMTAALLDRGVAALGIDVVPEAVQQTISRGGSALQRNLFEPLPAEGRWGTALLVDGNIGIGGDPVALLRRARDLVLPDGRVVVELAPPGVPHATRSAVLHCAGLVTAAFAWSVLGVDDVAAVAADAGLVVDAVTEHAGRWCAVLRSALHEAVLPASRALGGAA